MGIHVAEELGIAVESNALSGERGTVIGGRQYSPDFSSLSLLPAAPAVSQAFALHREREPADVDAPSPAMGYPERGGGM